jgi:Protein of unknown function (DUF3429)
MRSPRATPLAPLALGAAGLLPFAVLALATLSGPDAAFGLSAPFARTALVAYGAVVASFLGGIRWGLVAAEPDQGRVTLDYALAVVPALLAWAGLALPPPWDLRAVGALILLWGLVDQDLIRRGLAPAWLGRLRLALSLGAGAILLLAGAMG